jgi:hypothetical protein
MTIATNAAEARDRYQAALSADALIQGAWHTEVDGRRCACGLGVIGDEVNSPRKCPAAIMPRWLAQMVPWFFDRQKPEDAKAWGAAFYEQLARLDGVVPFSVAHAWHAQYTTALAVEVAQKKGKATAPHEALRALHERALAGDLASQEEWQAVLRHAYAYAYANADANAYANADADAYANAYAYANADAYAYANADADAHAYANAVKRLADGMVACLAAVNPS